MATTQMTQAKARQDFLAYFADLKTENAYDGGGVNRYREWELFLNHKIEENELPASASNWSCPRK